MKRLSASLKTPQPRILNTRLEKPTSLVKKILSSRAGPDTPREVPGVTMVRCDSTTVSMLILVDPTVTSMFAALRPAKCVSDGANKDSNLFQLEHHQDRETFHSMRSVSMSPTTQLSCSTRRFLVQPHPNILGCSYNQNPANRVQRCSSDAIPFVPWRIMNGSDTHQRSRNRIFRS